MKRYLVPLLLSAFLLPATLSARPADCIELDADSSCDVNWNGGAGTLQLEDGTNAWNGGPTVTLTWRAPKATGFEQIAASDCTFTAAGVCSFTVGAGILRVVVTGGTGADLVSAYFSLEHQASTLGGAATTSADVAETITGIWNFNAVANHEWSPLTFDVDIGDSTDEGQVRLGSFVLGTADDTVGGTALNDVSILYNTVDTALNVSFVLVDASANTPRLVIAEEGPDRALHNPRSIKIGPAATWATLAAGTLCSTDFDRIDCDTAGTGADLGLQDDLELGGSIFGDGGDGDGFEIAINFATATADRDFTFEDDGGSVCSDTNGRCINRGDLYLIDVGGTPDDWTASGTAFEKMTAFDTAGVVTGSVTASAANDELTISTAATCLAWFTVGFSGTGNRTIECRLYAGADGAEAGTHIYLPRYLGVGGDVGAMGTAMGTLSLSANDRLELWCKTDNATTTLDFWELLIGADC